MARRFFVSSENILPNGTVVVTGEEYNHMVNVLRVKKDDELTICDQSGMDYLCSVFALEKKQVVLKVLSKEQNKQEPNVKISVFQALVKGEKLEWITQKITELGATELIPFTSRFVTVKENTTRVERLEKISLEAAKQCGRAKSLQISSIQSFEQILSLLKGFDAVVFAYENATANLVNDLLNKQNVAIIIGSEGGFSTEEVEQLQKLSNVYTISLGNRILRAETAAIALTSVVGFCLKEWERK